MNIKAFSLSVIFSALLVAQPAATAADTTMATEQLAEIVLHMKDKPSEADKAALEEIAEDSASTIHERTLATTLLRVDQKIRPDDKKSIMKVWISPNASETERSIAKALLKFDSGVDTKNKEILSRLVTTE